MTTKNNPLAGLVAAQEEEAEEAHREHLERATARALEIWEYAKEAGVPESLLATVLLTKAIEGLSAVVRNKK